MPPRAPPHAGHMEERGRARAGRSERHFWLGLGIGCLFQSLPQVLRKSRQLDAEGVVPGIFRIRSHLSHPFASFATVRIFRIRSQVSQAIAHRQTGAAPPGALWGPSAGQI